jgi:hypothetical protein
MFEIIESLGYAFLTNFCKKFSFNQVFMAKNAMQLRVPH